MRLSLPLGLLLCAALVACETDKVDIPWAKSGAREAKKIKEKMPVVGDIKVEGAELSCSDTSHAADPLIDTCVTGTLRCGDIIEGNTTGGPKGWSDDFYRAHYCLPLPQHYTGPERIYRLDVPADTRMEARLESPCADLDLFALVWQDNSTCPHADHIATECEADDRGAGGKVQVMTDRNPKTLLIGVDGKQGATGVFRLQVTCEKL